MPDYRQLGVISGLPYISSGAVSSSLTGSLIVAQYDSTMQGQAQAAAAQGMALRYVGSLDLIHRKCRVELKVSVAHSAYHGITQCPVTVAEWASGFRCV